MEGKKLRRAAFAFQVNKNFTTTYIVFSQKMACQPKPWRRLVEAARVEPTLM
jgi:hypothetical protein